MDKNGCGDRIHERVPSQLLQHSLGRFRPTNPCVPSFVPLAQGVKRGVTSLGEGGVFGEVALLTRAPRQADCVAATR